MFDGLGNFLAAGIAFGIALLLASLARWLVRRYGRRRNNVSPSVQITARLSFTVIVAVGAYIALRIVGLDLGPALGGAGILGIAVVFGLRDIAENYIAGLLMGFRDSFQIGDQIISGEYEGTVEALDLPNTTIRTHDGLQVLLPNSQMIKNPLTNLTTYGVRRTDFTLGVAYGTDLEQACRVVVETVAQVPEVDPDHPAEAWIEELSPSWVTIRVRYWHPPRSADLWRVRHAVVLAVVRATEAQGIELPYEHSVVEVSGDRQPPQSTQ